MKKMDYKSIKKQRKKINLEEAFFGIRLFCWLDSSIRNLFALSNVKWAVARYVVMSKKEKESLLCEPLYFCFGDLSRKIEYKYSIRPVLGDKEIETDIFHLYVEPNAEYLMTIVDNISISSAKEYLAKTENRLKRLK